MFKEGSIVRCKPEYSDEYPITNDDCQITVTESKGTTFSGVITHHHYPEVFEDEYPEGILGMHVSGLVIDHFQYDPEYDGNVYGASEAIFNPSELKPTKSFTDKDFKKSYASLIRRRK